MALAKIKRALAEEIRMIKNNLPEPIKFNWNPNPDIILEPMDLKQFHKHYQKLAPTQEKQEQQLEKINTRLYNHCLIFCDFQYCNECDLIYNPPSCMIYTIPEEKKPISSCASELESIFNSNLNSNNNDDENNSFSSTQNGNENNNNLDSNSNFETFITLFDLIKEQELKWFSNNNEDIMPEYNDSEKAYIIEPNEKIAQAIFLLLVKIAQLVAVKKREELKIMAREIQSFRLIGRINIPVNMAEEKIIDKREIISTRQSIFILSYNKYMVVIEKKVKDQVQIFEAETTFYESKEIGLINLYILAKNHSHIKIPIYNNMGDIIEIPKKTIIGYLTTKIKEQLPNSISNFPQLCGYLHITF
ncbi:hypothetical protein G9A89_016302 [Geosiphon pyriformis]|nr:hypothetical protein G9A89_016302 [Geosiphon pyriformis]